jgi:cbb3-type cytochrome oxidase subunit 3
MNHWPFIIAAYGLTSIATLGVVWWAYAAMRKAEGRNE